MASHSDYCVKHNRPFSRECGDCEQEWLDTLPREERAVIYLRMSKWSSRRARQFVDDFRAMTLMDGPSAFKEGRK